MFTAVTIQIHVSIFKVLFSSWEVSLAYLIWLLLQVSQFPFVSSLLSYIGIQHSFNKCGCKLFELPWDIVLMYSQREEYWHLQFVLMCILRVDVELHIFQILFSVFESKLWGNNSFEGKYKQYLDILFLTKDLFDCLS